MTFTPPGAAPGASPHSQISPPRKGVPNLALAVVGVIVVAGASALATSLVLQRGNDPSDDKGPTTTYTVATAPPSSANATAPTISVETSRVRRNDLTESDALALYEAWTRNEAPTTDSLEPYFDSPAAGLDQMNADIARENARYSSSDFDVTIRSIDPDGPRVRLEVLLGYNRTGFSIDQSACGSVVSNLWLTDGGDEWLVSGVNEIEPEDSGVGYRGSGAAC